MYKEFDEYLNYNHYVDFWYDDGCLRAIEFLEKFDENDWIILKENIESKSIDWQIRFAYVAEKGINDEVLMDCLLTLSNTDNEDLFEGCIDSLREFIAVNNSLDIDEYKHLIVKIKLLLPKCSLPVKKMFEDFLKKIEN